MDPSELQAGFRDAEAELTAVRREIDEAIAGDAVRDESTAAAFHGRLEAAKERVRSIRVKLAEIDRAG